MSLLILGSGGLTAVAFSTISPESGGWVERWGGACKLRSPRNTKDRRKRPKSGPFDIYLPPLQPRFSRVHFILSCR